VCELKEMPLRCIAAKRLLNDKPQIRSLHIIRHYGLNHRIATVPILFGCEISIMLLRLKAALGSTALLLGQEGKVLICFSQHIRRARIHRNIRSDRKVPERYPAMRFGTRATLQARVPASDSTEWNLLKHE